MESTIMNSPQDITGSTAKRPASRRTFLQLGIATMGGLGLGPRLLAACSPAPQTTSASTPTSSGPQPTEKRMLVWGADSDVSRLNPQLSTQYVDTAVYDNLYD